ncbi:MAG TPA: trigger factor [bacterium]
MQIETISNWSKRITIEYPGDVVKKKTEDALNEVSKTAKLPGFRTGKIPRDVLESHFRNDVIEEVKKNLLHAGFMEAVEKNSLDPIANPTVETMEFDPESGMRAVLSVQVKPPVNLVDYGFLQVTVDRVSVSQEEVDNELESLRRRLAVLKPISEDRPCSDGDFIQIDISADIEGKKTEKGENNLVKLGSKMLYEDMEKEIVGMSKGDTKEIKFTIPDAHVDKSIAGRTAVFTVKLNEIKYEILPEIDDNLASSAGDYRSLEDLKAAIRDSLEKIKKIEQDNDIKRKIVIRLVEKNKVDAPPSMIEHEIKVIINRLSQRGLTEEHLTQELVDKIKSEAELQVKGKLIIEEIAKREKISVADDEVVHFLERIAAAEGKKLADVEHVLESPESAESIRSEIQYEKALSYLREKAKIDETSSVLWTPGAGLEVKK